jgi:SAM-dependent methyltransferase
MSETTYDRIGVGYADTRRADPRIAARIEAALGDARAVLNVGAGTGSYEPAGCEVTAVEPSAEMIAQRAPGTAPVVQASAEWLPFDDDSFDAALAVLTAHHWADLDAGLGEPLDSGAWEERYGHLRAREELDVGLRLVASGPDRRA